MIRQDSVPFPKCNFQLRIKSSSIPMSFSLRKTLCDANVLDVMVMAITFATRHMLPNVKVLTFL